MRIFLTGGTGFIGGGLARLLTERGDAVVALVRDRARATALAAQGVELARGDLGDEEAIRAAMSGCDAVIHAAAMYAVGIPVTERRTMYRANVLGTERILRVADELGVSRVVYVSTVNALGNTDGAIVDETHQHSGRYVSYYDETKHLAHEMARRAIAEGQDIVIAMPGAVYGPGDHSLIGAMLQRFIAGKLPVLALADVGVTAVHRDDAAAGILACLDHGGAGEAYVLGGAITTLRAMVGALADQVGRRAPRVTVPTRLLRTLPPFGPRIAGVLGMPPNLAETISAADGVTYWASHAKAATQLGYQPRPLDEGLRTLLSEPRVSPTATPDTAATRDTADSASGTPAPSARDLGPLG